jgi:hypothetical protein
MQPRRDLHFDTIDDAAAEVERLASVEVKTTGNYSFAQIVEHLARTLDVVSGHSSGISVPLPMRLAARLLRPFVLSRSMKPGFRLPPKAQEKFWPDEEVSVDDAVGHFRDAFNRYRETEPLPAHPFFGRMNRRQHDQLQCRHCELHLSFVHPVH